MKSRNHLLPPDRSTRDDIQTFVVDRKLISMLLRRLVIRGPVILARRGFSYLDEEQNTSNDLDIRMN